MRFIFVLLFLKVINSNNLHESNIIPDEQVLFQKILTNYDPAARPVYNSSKPVIILFNIALIQIIDMVTFFF